MAATNSTRYDRRRGPRDRRLRVGDTEREAVAEILRQAHVAGRLDSTEFEEWQFFQAEEGAQEVPKVQF